MTLREIEALLRQISTELWIKTVDNPDTATPASEEAGMTPTRRAIREGQYTVDRAVDAIEGWSSFEPAKGEQT